MDVSFQISTSWVRYGEARRKKITAAVVVVIVVVKLEVEKEETKGKKLEQRES